MQWPLTVLMKQTRQAVGAFKKLLLRCLWLLLRRDGLFNITHIDVSVVKLFSLSLTKNQNKLERFVPLQVFAALVCLMVVDNELNIL